MACDWVKSGCLLCCLIVNDCFHFRFNFDFSLFIYLWKLLLLLFFVFSFPFLFFFAQCLFFREPLTRCIVYTPGSLVSSFSMDLYNEVKTKAHGTLQSAVNAVSAVPTKSRFLEEGTLIPAEFVEAGDLLTKRFPTWAWASGDASSAVSWLPADKQVRVRRPSPSPFCCAGGLGAVVRLGLLDMPRRRVAPVAGASVWFLCRARPFWAEFGCRESLAFAWIRRSCSFSLAPRASLPALLLEVPHHTKCPVQRTC